MIHAREIMEQQNQGTHDSASRPKPKKLRRSTRACDFCHRRSIRCKPSVEPVRCQNCVDFDVACTYDRPAKKRGVKAGNGSGEATSKDASPSRDSAQHASLLLHLTNGNVHARARLRGHGAGNVPPDGTVAFELASEHREMVLANREKISNLINVYFEIASREYLKEEALFCMVMSICTLVSSKARDGALLPERWDASYFQQPAAEVFFAAAKDVMPQDLALLRGLDYMRSCAFLAQYGIQLGKTDIMHQYIGLYHSLVAMDGIHDEKNWPVNIGCVELEERRRLFWSVYTFEVYIAISWGGVIRCRESQSRVAYPSEVEDDDFISDHGSENRSSEDVPIPLNLRMTPEPVIDDSCWVHGWNFTIKLFRILEYAMNDFHHRRPRSIKHSSPSDLFTQASLEPAVVMDKVMTMYLELPPRFKQRRNDASETSEDIVGFQAANIVATIQLVRMVLFTAKDATVSQKCSIAREILEDFSKVPTKFLRVLSAPLIHHLAGIGSILGSVIEGPLSEKSYLQARGSLLSMADLLANLEIGITSTVSAAVRIRNLIQRIDEYLMILRPPTDYAYLPPSQQPGLSTGLALSQSSYHLAGAMPLSTAVMITPHPNVDPALQDLPLQTQHWNGQVLTQDAYTIHLNGGTSFDSVSGPESAEWARNIEQFQFQIPPELLQDWPWGSGVALGLMRLDRGMV